MPWRVRTARPISLRFHEADPVGRPPLKFVARRIPAGERYVDRPVWQLAPLSADAREKLAGIAPVCDAWEARLPDEKEVTALVLAFNPWPDDLVVHLSDKPRHGRADRHYPIVALTRHSATSVWGGSETNGFQQLADDLYDERDALAAPDMGPIGTLAP
jgi:hypothetical protein